MKVNALLPAAVLFLVTPLPAQLKEPVFAAGFENTDASEGWTGAQIDRTTGFKSSGSVFIEKTEATLRAPIKAVGPAFPMKQGSWEFRFATRTDLQSMDNSYKGVFAVEFLDHSGKLLERTVLAEPYRKTSWKPAITNVQAPKGTLQARLTMEIEKETPGKFWLDEVSVSPGSALANDRRIQRMMISHTRLGNLLLPDDPKKLKVELWASEELPAGQLKVHAQVCDYWGEEQGSPVITQLKKSSGSNDRVVYTGEADLSAVPLETGRYYELRARIDREGAVPFTDFNSFAILPEAPANQYRPEEVPFTARNWDNRFPEFVKLTHRLGVRICGVWGRMESDAAKVDAPQIELVRDLGMGYMTGSPAHGVEQRKVKLDEEKLRQAVRNYFQKYGEIRPVFVNLGNEPHSRGEDVKTDVEAYRIVYDEIKKIDPNIYVVGSSFGTTEEYFRYGAGEWLDAYDFHTYESPEHLRDLIRTTYPELFHKYGHAKPIWSTEVGLNSQGMSRLSVAGALFRKFAWFFAGGGANVSWFGLLYPDEEGKRDDSGPSAHNIFFCRYNKYAPKLDALAYYNAVNGIGIKRYKEEKQYEHDLNAFLFRDSGNSSMQLWFKEKGRADLFIPMPEVKSVEVVRIDGSRRILQAKGKGITLSVDSDPVMLLYQGTAKLPQTPGQPAISLAALPDSFVRGGLAKLLVRLDSASLDQVSLKAGSTEWPVQKTAGKDSEGNRIAEFSFTIPEESAANEADLTVSLEDQSGQLYVRPKVSGAVTGTLLPAPASVNSSIGLRFVLQNNSPKKQQMDWSMELIGQQTLSAGAMGPIEPPQAYFAEVPSGSIAVEAGSSAEVVVPLADANLYAVYRVAGRLRDSSGRVTVYERPVGGFYGVPRALNHPVMDGKLDDVAWQSVAPRTLDRPEQFYAYTRKDKPPQTWSGPEDLSGTFRFLWDEEYLYVGMEVTDDNAGILQENDQIWYQDGLQFLIDPARTSAQKPGKYDYAIGKGKKGIQAWSYLSADGGAPTGEVKDMKIAIENSRPPGSGHRTYEVAIPWSRLAPFKPEAGANLGLTFLLNEDDGNNRDAYMLWFANASTKDVDTVGDLILLDN